MNFGDPEQLELNELCNALIDGSLDASRRARLGEMLGASEEARRFYIRAMALSASLHEYAGEMQSEPADAPANERPARVWSAIGALAAAAAVILALWLGAWVKSDDDPEIASADESVARISGAKNCAWIGAALAPGGELRRGQRIELASGFAEITFDSGARITLEGPAALDVTSEWDAALSRGTLRASIPAEAIGFHLSAPAVDAVEPGTEFGVVAESGEVSEIFVEKGAVELPARDAAGPMVLRENEARRLTANSVSEVSDRARKLARMAGKIALDRLVNPANYAHWSFDEIDGVRFAAEAIGAGASGMDAVLQSPADADISKVRAPGRFGSALRLDGATFAAATLPGLTNRSPRTAALWVRVPEDAPLSNSGAMLAWRIPGVSRSFELGWNRDPGGVLGAPRIKTGRSAAAGSTSLRDGRWHHLAIVLRPGRKPDAVQVRQYVDGRLEGFFARRGTSKHGTPRAPEANGPGDGVLWIGRGIDGACFRGELDELFLADRALSQPEVHALMLHNRPSLPESFAAN
jgi:ferric-dicitrate binding protein FerR (iron transport regulator)